jgi:peroxiredoxin
MTYSVRCAVPLIASILTFVAHPVVAKDVTPLAIGAPAPELNLPGVDGKTYRLDDFADAKILVVIFTCNHCPTAQAYEQRIIQLHADYRDRGVAVVAISPNDPLAVRLDELGYTDIGDSFEEMKRHAKRRGFKFPYLYDGETQRVATAFGVLATPHVFIFDWQRLLRYNGRIDDADIKPPKSHDARNAIEDLLAGRAVAVPQTRVFGCSTKWADKRDSAKKAIENWNAESVELQAIDAIGLRKLVANETDKFRLVNVWSTTCAPCISELPEFVTVNRMYRDRHFEMYILAMDAPDARDAVLKLLQMNHVSCTNYIFQSDNRDELAEALDPEWKGPVPYSLLIAPGGNIVRRWKEEINPDELKGEISNRLGRTYASRANDLPEVAPATRPIKSLKRLENTVKRFGGKGDNWHMSWAEDDKVYVSLCDGQGLPGTPPGNFNSRMYAIVDDMPNVNFEYLPSYPDLPSGPGRETNRYYNFGTLALDGRLYQFLSTPNHPFGEPQPKFVGAKLIFSPDNGKTWCNQDGSSPVRWEKWEDRTKENMVFFEEPGDSFALITVLQMGKNYSQNKDGFVYLFAPNGSVEGTMNQLVLCRMPRDKVGDRGAYEFFAGRTEEGGARWSKDIVDRAVVHTFPTGWVNKHIHPYAWHPSVIYFAPSGQYLMANWGMGIDVQGNWFGKPSYLGFWTAREPWGPWKQVYEEKQWTPAGDHSARAYQPQIAPKWIAADGKKFWLVWTDFQSGGKYYQFNAQQVEVEYEPVAGGE